jgi:hypothetical protein
MPFYPSKILTSSKIRSLWYPERTLRVPMRLPAGGSWLAGQIFYETLTQANATQTLTFSGATGGTFSLLFASQTGYDLVGPVTYSGTAATLKANLQAALDAYFGPSQCVVSGSGSPYTLTYSGNLVANMDVLLPVTASALTGGGATVTIAAGVTGSGGLSFFEPYTAGSASGQTYVILEENTRTSAQGTILDEHGDTGKQTTEGLGSGVFTASALIGADTTLFPSDGTFGRMGKFRSGGWNTYPTLYTGSTIFVPGF